MTQSTNGSDIAVTAKWGATCKDCRAARAAFERSGGTAASWERQHDPKDPSREDFDYPDEWASRTLERGESRSDRCPECRKRHSANIRAFPVAYVDIAAIGEASGADDAGGPSGPLGGLGPLPTLHVRDETTVHLQQFALGINDEIMLSLLEKMRTSQVVILEAGTGTGKSTLAPFRMMNTPEDATYRPTDFGPIIVTEPRIPATTKVAMFVGESMCFDHDPEVCTKHVGPGYPVGYQCDGQKAWDDSCRLIYVTDGSMINLIKNGELSKFSVVVIDEAHERSENIDTILTLLHQNLRRFPNLRVVIASATLDRDFFLEFFADAANGVDYQTVDAPKVIGYGVPLFPGVTFDDTVLKAGRELDGVQYEGWRTSASDTDQTNLRAVTKQLLELRPPVLAVASLAELKGKEAAVLSANQAFRIIEAVCNGSIPEGDIISFLPGEDECLKAKSAIEAKLEENPLPVHVYWLMKATDEAEKDLATSTCRPGEYKVIFASNLAETSLTIPGLRYVIDAGLIKQAKWNSALASSSVPTVTHSRSGVRQRWGRVGRKTYGWVFPLYTIDQFLAMPKDTPPGSTQVNLEKTLLTLISAGVDDLESIKLPANFATTRRDTAGIRLAVDYSAEIRRSLSSLKINGALTPEGDITPLGRELDRSRLSSERTIALMFADRLACMPEVALAMVVLDGGTLAGRHGILRADWDWPAAWNVHARRCHEALAIGCRDDLDLVLRIYTEWEAAPNPAEWSDQWWIDHERLTAYREDAFKLVDALAPGMSKRAERTIDLRLADRARAVFSRALRSLQYRRESDGWYSENPDPLTAPEPVSIPDGLLVTPSDRVVALRRELPRPRWGQPVKQRSVIQGLIEVLPWASDGEMDPFQLMIRARQQLRGLDDNLAVLPDPCRPLRAAWPVGAIRRSTEVVDVETVRPGSPLDRVSLGLKFPGVPRDAIDDDGESPVKGEGLKVDAGRPARRVYTSNSSGFDEASGEFGTALFAVAGVERPAEELAMESRDVRGLEVDDYEGLNARSTFADIWRSSTLPDENPGVEDSLSRCDVDSALDASAFVVRGYAAREGKATVVWAPATRIEVSGEDASLGAAWVGDAEKLVLAGELVNDHFGPYRVLRTCAPDHSPDGEAIFYFDGPMLDEWDSGVAATIWEGSVWEVTAIPGGRKYESQSLTLVPTMFARVAPSLGLMNPEGAVRYKSRVTGVVAGPAISTRGKVDCIPVKLDANGLEGFTPRVLIPISDLSPPVDSLPVGTPVRVEVGPKLKARRSGRWPEEALNRLTKTPFFTPAEQGSYFYLVGADPLSEEARQVLLDDQAADEDLTEKIWQLWAASHHVGAFSLQISGSGNLDPDFAAIVHGSTFRSVLSGRHEVDIEFDGVSGKTEIHGTDPHRVASAMTDLERLGSTFAAVFQLPARRPKNQTVIDQSIKDLIASLQSTSGVIALHLDLRKREVNLLAEQSSVTQHIEEALRAIIDTVSAVFRFPDDESLIRSQRSEGFRSLLPGAGCTSARLSSGNRREWTVEARSEEAINRMLSVARSQLAAPGILLQSIEAQKVDIKRVSGQFTSQRLPPETTAVGDTFDNLALPGVQQGPLMVAMPEPGRRRAAYESIDADPVTSHSTTRVANSIEAEGNTIAEAILAGCRELGVSRDDVSYSVLDEGERSVLFRTVRRRARVQVTIISA